MCRLLISTIIFYVRKYFFLLLCAEIDSSDALLKNTRQKCFLYKITNSYRLLNAHPRQSNHGVSRVSVTSTVLCVVIWLLDIIILALSYSEFCKETQNIEILVNIKDQRIPRPYSIPPTEFNRKCFAKDL